MPTCTFLHRNFRIPIGPSIPLLPTFIVLITVRSLYMAPHPPMGCSVLGRRAEPLVRTQFPEHPPNLNFGANHQKKWIQHPQKPPIPFLSPHNPHHRDGFFWGGVKELEQS